MPSCTLRLELDQGVVCAGSAVSGTVVVAAQTSVPCEELAVRLSWVRQGRVARQVEPVASQLLPCGSLPAGEHRFAFTLAVPVAPLTASTEVLSVSWEVTAEAACGAAGAPSAAADVTVVRDPARPEQRADLGEPPPEVLPPHAGGYLLGAMFVGLGGVAAYVSGTLFFGGFGVAAVPLVVGLGFVAVGAAQLWRQASTQLRRGRLSTFTVEAPARWVGAGETLELPVRIAAHRPEQLLGVTVTLVHEGEVHVRRPDRDTERLGARVEVDRAVAWEALGVAPGRPAETRVTLQVPPDAPPTFHWRGCAMAWFLVLEGRFGDTGETVTEDVRLRVG